ncbi:hypothetical protein ACS0TY_021757 [Phlomoides rotata]
MIFAVVVDEEDAAKFTDAVKVFDRMTQQEEYRPLKRRQGRGLPKKDMHRFDSNK